jgi:hypothetical protein
MYTTTQFLEQNNRETALPHERRIVDYLSGKQVPPVECQSLQNFLINVITTKGAMV